jgi:paired amphipathic helix protein Sin3a
LYSRLDKLKKLAAKETTRHKVNPVAEGMAIHYRLPTLSDYDLDHDNYYRIELDLIARLFAQELDKNGFEDSTRYLFGTQGYILFTVSHVAQSILRQASYIHSIHLHTYDLTYSLDSTYCE